jgi:hypothetical protein
VKGVRVFGVGVGGGGGGGGVGGGEGGSGGALLSVAPCAAAPAQRRGGAAVPGRAPPGFFVQLLGGRGPLGLPGGPNGPKIGLLWGTQGGGVSPRRADAPMEVHEAGRIRPPSGLQWGAIGCMSFVGVG